MPDKKKLNISYDQDEDILTIEGMKYSGDLFRAFADSDSESLEMEKDKNGKITIHFPKRKTEKSH